MEPVKVKADNPVISTSPKSMRSEQIEKNPLDRKAGQPKGRVMHLNPDLLRLQ
jgi:hypothetical protein